LVDRLDVAASWLAGELKARADNVKLIASGGILTRGTDIGNPRFTVAEMQAAVEEAHAAGKTANAHAHGAEGIKRAATAGVDSIEHCYFIDPERHRHDAGAEHCPGCDVVGSAQCCLLRR